MKAAVLEQIGKVILDDRPEPRILDPGDAIVRVTTAGICGSDLHIIHGRDPGIRLGTIMGHEFAGAIVEIGDEVSGFAPGDRVLAPFTVNCGECFYCKRELPARCVHSQGFGFVGEDGRGIQGAQAEYVRVPLASSSLMQIPAKLTDEDVLFLGDIFSTAYSCVEAASIHKGDVLAVIGCGPVGLLCVKAAQLLEPSAIVAMDLIDYRLEKAKKFGAIAMKPETEILVRTIAEMTEGRGADAAVEAVGSSKALDQAIALVRPGAVVSIAGYHTQPAYAFPIHTAYLKNLTLRIGRCHARKYMQQLLPLVQAKRVSFGDIITHTLPLSDVVHGYDLFTNHLQSAIKVLLKP